ncbi:MAG: hypothetical protein KDC18_01180 [Alphaproteobacteria bacterium]|nr:hypothetical protein [Alphaproteobacteria bacterium]MCB9928238.1 hypothetical protein [Alphaproteobacteria bacterium]
MRYVLTALLAVVLSACASDGAQVSFSDYTGYSSSIAQYGARNGTMALAVFGNPTRADQATLDAAVADGLRGTHVDRDTVFVPAEPPPMAGYRTVVAFGGATQQQICRPDFRPAAAPKAATADRLAAAYCLDDQELSYVSARHGALSGPNDPALHRLLNTMGHELFPLENPNMRDGCAPWTGGCD